MIRNRFWRRDLKKGWTPEQTDLVNKVEKRLQKLQVPFNFLGPSPKKTKKLRLVYTDDGGKLRAVDFGDKNSSTFIEGASQQKRNAYIARHSKILLKDGSRAIDKLYSPAWCSMYLLW